MVNIVYTHIQIHQAELLRSVHSTVYILHFKKTMTIRNDLSKAHLTCPNDLPTSATRVRWQCWVLISPGAVVGLFRELGSSHTEDFKPHSPKEPLAGTWFLSSALPLSTVLGWQQLARGTALEHSSCKALGPTLLSAPKLTQVGARGLGCLHGSTFAGVSPIAFFLQKKAGYGYMTTAFPQELLHLLVWLPEYICNFDRISGLYPACPSQLELPSPTYNLPTADTQIQK